MNAVLSIARNRRAIDRHAGNGAARRNSVDGVIRECRAAGGDRRDCSWSAYQSQTGTVLTGDESPIVAVVDIRQRDVRDGVCARERVQQNSIPVACDREIAERCAVRVDEDNAVNRVVRDRRVSDGHRRSTRVDADAVLAVRIEGRIRQRDVIDCGVRRRTGLNQKTRLPVACERAVCRADVAHGSVLLDEHTVRTTAVSKERDVGQREAGKVARAADLQVRRTAHDAKIREGQRSASRENDRFRDDCLRRT